VHGSINTVTECHSIPNVLPTTYIVVMVRNAAISETRNWYFTTYQ
jgi:hypothetical protein